MKTKVKDLHDTKMLERVKANISLSGPAWHSMMEDFKDGESKAIICSRYQIPPKYYKWVKKIVEGL